MVTEPTFSAISLLEQLRGRFEQLCQDVTGAVNAAPAGQVINASEEKVRDLLADFRQATYTGRYPTPHRRRASGFFPLRSTRSWERPCRTRARLSIPS